MAIQSEIAPCTCSHDYQDKIYGSNKRVKIKYKVADAKTYSLRCTVCGKEGSKFTGKK